MTDWTESSMDNKKTTYLYTGSTHKGWLHCTVYSSYYMISSYYLNHADITNEQIVFQAMFQHLLTLYMTIKRQ